MDISGVRKVEVDGRGGGGWDGMGGDEEGMGWDEEGNEKVMGKKGRGDAWYRPCEHVVDHFYFGFCGGDFLLRGELGAAAEEEGHFGGDGGGRLDFNIGSAWRYWGPVVDTGIMFRSEF